MDVNQIFDQGGYIVPNPEYNKREKKNPKPQYLLSKDPVANQNALAALTKNDYLKTDQLAFDERLHEYGIPQRRGMDTTAALADAQSGWAKVFNSVGQTLLSEIGVGTFKGISDLFGYFGGKLGITDDPYHNAVSNMFSGWQEYLENEAMPIYADPTKNILNGGLADVGWYAKNFPSVASSLTLLLPAAGATKALSYLGKATRLNKGISNARKWLGATRKLEEGRKLNFAQRLLNSEKAINTTNAVGKTLSESYLMRTMENYQEAGEVHNQTYDESMQYFNNMTDDEFAEWGRNNADLFRGMNVNINDKTSVSKAIAKKAADKTFGMDFANLTFDFIQLWGVRKGLQNFRKVKGKGVSKAQRESIQDIANAGAKAQGREIAEDVAKTSLANRAFTATKDFLKDFGGMIASESTEALEEGLNYVAQQEGITYGKMMMKGITEDQNRSVAGEVLHTIADTYDLFSRYKNNAELYDQAFWGLAGGVVFGGFASKFNKYRTKKANEKHLKKLEEMGVNMEEYKKLHPYLDLYDNAETKAAKDTIYGRIGEIQSLKDDLASIANDDNIYVEKNEDGSYKKFTDPIEKEYAATRRIAEFRAMIAKNALNSGTYDLLVDYFQSDLVRDAMIDLGITTKEDADAFIKETLSDMEEVRKIYQEQSEIALSQATAINSYKGYKEDVPIEYTRIIAAQNTDQILTSHIIQRQMDMLDRQASDIIQKLENSGEDTKQYEKDKELIRLGALTDLYSRLEADKRYINENVEDGIEKRMQIEYINGQQNAIKQILRQSAPQYMLNAMRTAKTYRKVLNDDGTGKKSIQYFIDRQDAAYETIDDNLVKEFEELYKDNKEAIGDIDSVKQLAQVVRQDIKNLNAEQSLKNQHEDLFTNYARRSILEYNKILAQSKVATTKQQVMNEIDLLHNRLNNARLQAIKEADMTINDFYNQYKDRDQRGLEEAILNVLDGNREAARRRLETFMEPGDVQQFFDSIDILRFTDSSNQAIAGYILDGIRKQKEFDARESEDSSASENQSESMEEPSTENPPSTPLEQPTQSVSEALEGLSMENQPSEEPNTNQLPPTQKVGIKINSNGEVNVVNESQIDDDCIVGELREESPGKYELTIPEVDTDIVSLIIAEVYNTNNPSNVPLYQDGVTLHITQEPAFKLENGRFVLVTPGLVEVQYNANEESESEDATSNVTAGTNTTSPVENNDATSTGETMPTIPIEPLPDNSTEGNTEGGTNESIVPSIGEVESTDNEDAADVVLLTEQEYKRQRLQEAIANYMQTNNYNPLDPNTNFDGIADDLKSLYASEYSEDLIDEFINNAKAARDKFIELQVKVAENNVGVNAENENIDISEIDEYELGFSFLAESLSDYSNSGNEIIDEIIRFIGVAVYNSNDLISIIGLYGVYAKSHWRETHGHNGRINFDFALNKRQFVSGLRSLVMSFDISERRNDIADEVADEVGRIAGAIMDAMKAKAELWSPIDNPVDITTDAAEVGFFARFESPDTTFSNLFKESAESFIQKYVNTTILPVVDGKQVIKLSDILRLVKDSFGDTTGDASKHFYNVIKAYLYNNQNDDTNDAPNRYIILDEEDIASGEILKKIYGTPKQNEESEDRTDKQRANLQDWYENLDNFGTEEDKNQFISVLNSLKKGDKLVAVDAGNSFLLQKDGVTVAVYNKPTVEYDGTLRYTQHGFVIRARRDEFGVVQSEFKNFVKEIFNGNDQVNKDLRRIIFDAYINGIDDNLIARFENNKKISDEIKRSKTAPDNLIFREQDGSLHNSKDLLSTLVNISLRYINAQNVGTNVVDNTEILNESLDGWFEKQYQAFESVAYLPNNGEVIVESVNFGKLIPNKTATESGGITYDDHVLVADAIDDEHEYKITVVDNTRGYVSGVSNNVDGFEGVGLFGTLITTFDGNGHPYYTNAWGIKLNDEEAIANSQLAKSLIDGSVSHLENLLREQSDASLILEELTKILSIKNSRFKSNISLFRAISGRFDIGLSNNGSGVILRYKDKSGQVIHSLYISTRQANQEVYGSGYYLGYSVNGNIAQYQNTNPDIAGSIGKAFRDIITKVCQINLDVKGIKMDNSTDNLNGGFIQKVDGKIKIFIPNTGVNVQFDSYNDFMIKGNLIKVNLKKNENGNNFNKFSQNDLRKQNLFVSLPLSQRPTINPNDRYEHVDDTDPLVVGRMDSIKTTIETPSDNKGISVIREILPEDERSSLDELISDYKKLGKEVSLTDIFPQDIVYDADMNLWHEAQTDNDISRWLGVVAASKGSNSVGFYPTRRLGENTKRSGLDSNTAYVGTWWLNMAASNNRFRRRQAIGKLIHEALHNRLAKNPEERKRILDGIDSIRKEFVAEVNSRISDIVKTNPTSRTKNQKDALKVYESIIRILTNPRTDVVRNEEFLVESFTNKAFYDVLNSIKVEDAGTSNKETLWSKLLNLLAKFFGWNTINDNSLLQKELNILRELADTSNSNDVEVNEGNNEDTSTPVEGNMDNADDSSVTPKTPEEFNEDDIQMEDSGDSLLGDVDSYFASEEIVTPAGIKYNTKLTSEQEITLDGALKQLSPENREAFKSLVYSGIYEITCK